MNPFTLALFFALVVSLSNAQSPYRITSASLSQGSGDCAGSTFTFSNPPTSATLNLVGNYYGNFAARPRNDRAATCNVTIVVDQPDGVTLGYLDARIFLGVYLKSSYSANLKIRESAVLSPTNTVCNSGIRIRISDRWGEKEKRDLLTWNKKTVCEEQEREFRVPTGYSDHSEVPNELDQCYEWIFVCIPLHSSDVAFRTQK